jgi:hypothetical protein
MESKVLTWVAVTCIGVGNLYIGRLIALWRLPRGVAGKRSWQAGAFFISLWLSGLALLHHANGFQLTFAQACILSICVAGSYVSHRAYYGTGEPRVPWDEYLNKKLHTVMRICERHEWDTSSTESFRSLAASNGIHFDGGDYDLLVQIQSDLEYNLRNQTQFLVPHTAEGGIDYDRACAREIVTLAGSLAGFESHEGIVTRVSQDYDMSGFDRDAYERLQWLAEAIREQWDLARLWDDRHRL